MLYLRPPVPPLHLGHRDKEAEHRGLANLPKITQIGPPESPLGCALENGLKENRGGRGGGELGVMQGSFGAGNSGADSVSRMPSGGQRQRERHKGREVGTWSCCLEHSGRS